MEKPSKQTKLYLAETYKVLLKKEKTADVSISDLMAAAGLSRKTFYYYFHSIEELLEWIINNDIFDNLRDYDPTRGLHKELYIVTDYMKDNFELLQAANKNIGRGIVHKFLHKNLYPAVMMELLRRGRVSDPEYLEFEAEYYTEAITGVLQNWLDKPKLRNRKQITEYLMLTAEKM